MNFNSELKRVSNHSSD